MRPRLQHVTATMVEGDDFPGIVEHRRTGGSRFSVGEILHATLVSVSNDIVIQGNLLREAVGMLDNHWRGFVLGNKGRQRECAPMGTCITLDAHNGESFSSEGDVANPPHRLQTHLLHFSMRRSGPPDN